MGKILKNKRIQSALLLIAGFCAGLLVMWLILTLLPDKNENANENIKETTGQEYTSVSENKSEETDSESDANTESNMDSNAGSDSDTTPDTDDTPDTGQNNDSGDIADTNETNTDTTPDSENTGNNADTDDKTDTSTDSKSDSNAAPDDKVSTNSIRDTWDKNTVYLGGDTVIWKNRIYRAKWWTQGETPGQADVWEDTKETPAPNNTKGKDGAKNDSTTDSNTGASNNTNAGSDGKDDTDSAKHNHKGDDTMTGNDTVNYTKDDSFKITGYFPSWKPQDADHIRYDILTHVIYAFAIPTAEGDLRPLENADTAKEIIRKAHKNDTKVLLAVGGWSYQDVPLEATFMSATETKEKREKLADALFDICMEYGFDGIDMDWEHPRVDGDSWKRYEDLILRLAKKLHAKDKTLTSAVLSGATADGNIYYDSAAHTDKVLEALDWIHVMAYDGGDGERHSSYDFAVNCGKYWHETRGLSSEKVVLGVPFYGRPSWASYKAILEADPKAWSKDQAQINGMTAHYNGVDTMKKKTRYAKKNLGGIMIWEITQDTDDKDKSLLSAIAAEAAK